MKDPIKKRQQRCPINERLRDSALAPLIDYMGVSKADGSSQVFYLQKDALIAAGVSQRHLYSDAASGKKDDRPASPHARLAMAAIRMSVLCAWTKNNSIHPISTCLPYWRTSW
jgi:hypothetical protein